jgi:uncharacterized HhH-GPD family protein
MPKLERLSWISPLDEGRGVTLSDDPAADLLLAEDPNALLLGVLYDSQYATRRAFAAPLRLKERLGHLDMARIAAEDPAVLQEVFGRKPALHRFPRRYAGLTQQLAAVIVSQYSGDSARIWREATGAADLGARLMALPAFGEEKTNWTIGMLGILGLLPFEGWQEYRVEKPRRRPAQSGASSAAAS